MHANSTRTCLGITVLAGAAFLAGCATTASTAHGNHGEEVITTPTATLVVHGMSCPLCANNVDAQLMDIQGVRSVDLDMGSGEVKVSFEQGAAVTHAQLARAIERSGFTLVGLSTP